MKEKIVLRSGSWISRNRPLKSRPNCSKQYKKPSLKSYRLRILLIQCCRLLLKAHEMKLLKKTLYTFFMLKARSALRAFITSVRSKWNGSGWRAFWNFPGVIMAVQMTLFAWKSSWFSFKFINIRWPSFLIVKDQNTPYLSILNARPFRLLVRASG